MSSKKLLVHKKLILSHLIVEKKRIKATYTLVKHDGSSYETELIYSYNQDYFEPKNPFHINLASMMASQVAINYGLFFEEIELNGLFDKTDERFVLDMFENTAREIYVNKFLFENEFLTEAFQHLEPTPVNKYLNARIIFNNAGFEGFKIPNAKLETLEDHYTILSSGGKDSLLTYGLIKEIGTPHPIFINESGRHWFTAINSFKKFSETEPNTAKPWCNSDRLFNFMVRHMPFIKPNFQNIRADIYPIRLWTVAVFVFGVLPIALKRKTKNILVGNEYDSTNRTVYNGITHYNATYDQSHYFDNALTRYYHQKGWNLNQYSILRPLSEMLILKTLVKRYPDLQKEQVSCHASHEKDGRILPCGKCEKCRRIIGMLKTLNEDPKRCGYTDEQIAKGLQALEQKSVKQLGSDAAHLYHLLVSKKLITETDFTRKNARSNESILSLRFDQLRSRIADLPKYIRKPLFNMLKEHANGTTILENRKWQSFNDFNDMLERTPYLTEKQ